MGAPDIPAWLDCTKGALSCQHSRLDLPLAAAMVVMFSREGTARVVGRMKARKVKMDRV